MSMMDSLLQQVAGAMGAKPEAHFEDAAQAAPAHVLGQSLTAMFRSEHTAPFANMVGQLFGQSNATQQAGMLNQMLAAAGPALLSSSMAGALGRVLAPGATQLTPEQARQLSPAEVEQIAALAERTNPSVVESVGHLYAEHAALIKTLGSAALAIAMAKLSEHQHA